MWRDRISNTGPLAHGSDVLPTAPHGQVCLHEIHFELNCPSRDIKLCVTYNHPNYAPEILRFLGIIDQRQTIRDVWTCQEAENCKRSSRNKIHLTGLIEGSVGAPVAMAAVS